MSLSAQTTNNQRSPIQPSNATAQEQPAASCFLADLSLQMRCGFRGINASAHLLELGLPVPQKPNQASATQRGLTVLRLSPNEFWILADANVSAASFTLISESNPPAQCYPLFCQDSHAWLELSGAHLANIMAKVSAVDMREPAFAVGSIAQTSVAKVNAIVIHRQTANGSAFSLLSDSASANYLWQAVVDAMLEFNR